MSLITPAFTLLILVLSHSFLNYAIELSENNSTTPVSDSDQTLATTVFPEYSTNVYFYDDQVDYNSNSEDETSSISTTISDDVVDFETTTAQQKDELEPTTTVPTPSPTSDPKPTPNVIIIIADDLGFNDVSFHGSPQIPTPNIDALAFSGVILNSYYVSPICTPSRSAIFSGRHPIHTGMQHNVIFGATPYGFPLEYRILPEYLKDLGYATALVGKWHLGHFRRKYTPTCRGFDSHYGHWTGHKDYYDNMAQENGAWGYDMRRNFETTYENFGEYTTDLYTDEANSIIHNHNKSQPLFLTISHTAVHSANPYQLLQAPKENVDSFAETIPNIQRRTYAAMVQKLDESVGSVVKTLFEQQMLDNSIIIFTTDNGGPAAGFNGNAASNWPLRGVKNTLWEGGVRGAALVWSPMIEEEARGVSKELIHIQDWLPTILKAIGVGDPKKLTGDDIDGMDLWDTIRLGKPSPRTEVLHNIDDIFGNEAVRLGPWKLLHGTTYNGNWDGWYGPSGRAHNKTKSFSISPQKLFSRAKHSLAGKAVSDLKMFPNSPIKISHILKDSEIHCNNRTGMKRRKNSCSLKDGDYCLFNINDDPCEYNNLVNEFPNVLDQLKGILQRYRQSAVRPRNKPKDLNGLPIHWNYTWTNWVDFLEENNSECD